MSVVTKTYSAPEDGTLFGEDGTYVGPQESLPQLPDGWTWTSSSGNPRPDEWWYIDRIGEDSKFFITGPLAGHTGYRIGRLGSGPFYQFDGTLEEAVAWLLSMDRLGVLE